MTLRRYQPLHPSKGTRHDRVSEADAQAVFARDGGCLAPRLGGSSMDCWGRNRIEHVKREQRMGVRGDLLGTLCEGHTEPGMRAGYVWCTNAENREAMRRHLLLIEEGGCTHVEPVHGCASCRRHADPLTVGLA
jgi:hypothetical protein